MALASLKNCHFILFLYGCRVFAGYKFSQNKYLEFENFHCKLTFTFNVSYLGGGGEDGGSNNYW